MFSVRHRYVFALLLGLYSSLNVRYTGGEKLFEFAVPFWLLCLLLSFIVTGVWELNRQADLRLVPLVTARFQRAHALIILFLVSLFNVIIVCSVALQLLYPLLDTPPAYAASHLKLLLVFGFRVNLFLQCINAIVHYMNRLKTTQLEAEQFKKISIEARFEALRGQINPHFLFNCFNVLSTLVYKDAELSARFISQLSNVYRYLLFNLEKKVVTLDDELAFLDSYLFLIKMRFGNNIFIEKKVASDLVSLFVAPAVLQMLIENAIKHNVVSRKKPLRISIDSHERSITVSNNLQVKDEVGASSHLGLKNIQSRYLFLTDEEVSIERTASHFTVTIPLLEKES